MNPLRTIAQELHPTRRPNVSNLDLALDLPHRIQLLAPVHHLFMVLKMTVTVGVEQKLNA